jgi:hypothetical protein
VTDRIEAALLGTAAPPADPIGTWPAAARQGAAEDGVA